VNWLATLLAKLFREILDWGQKQSEKPGEMLDAQTPENIRRGWRDYLRDKLRDKDDDRH
jgi:hypothetical protein